MPRSRHPSSRSRSPPRAGSARYIEVDDADLAAVVSELVVGRPRAPLLAYRKGKQRVPLTPEEVNAYIREIAGGPVHGEGLPHAPRHDPRRRGARAHGHRRHRARSASSAEALAVRATAEALGNTPAVARSSYIDPRVFARYARGRLLDLGESPESAIRDLLAR